MNRTYKSRSKGIIRKSLMIAGIIAAAAGVGVATFLLRVNELRNSANSTVTLECGHDITIDLFFDKVPADAAFITDISQIDVNKEGSYKISINNSGYVTRSVLNISDTTAPTGEAVPQKTFLHQIPDPNECVINVSDIHDVTVEFEDGVEDKLGTPGPKMVGVVLTDSCKNSNTIEVPFDVVDDSTAPFIDGVTDFVFEVGEFESFDFLEGITTNDDYDNAPILTVDASSVDFLTIGEYEIIYSSTDEAGNCREVIAIVAIVKKRVDDIPAEGDAQTDETDTSRYRKDLSGGERRTRTTTNTGNGSGSGSGGSGGSGANPTQAAEQTGEPSSTLETGATAKKAYDAARKVYNSIISSGMSKEQKAFKIVWWCHKNIKYSTASMDETSWAKACIQALKTKKANCYGYYATCKAMFDLAGISNKQVKRNSSHKHYWNLVYLNGGWYHCDATPFRTANKKYVFMMTNKEIRSLNFGDYIFVDPSPAVSTLSVQSCLNYSKGTIIKPLPSPSKPTSAATTAAPATESAEASPTEAAETTAAAATTAPASETSEAAATTAPASEPTTAPTTPTAADPTTKPEPVIEVGDEPVPAEPEG